jgi:hypothetical protein
MSKIPYKSIVDLDAGNDDLALTRKIGKSGEKMLLQKIKG